jgi:hypothetical protein
VPAPASTAKLFLYLLSTRAQGIDGQFFDAQ